MINRLWKKFKQWCCDVGLCNLNKCKNHIKNIEVPKIKPTVIPVIKKPKPHLLTGSLAKDHGVARPGEKKVWCECKYDGNAWCECRRPEA